MQGTMIGALYLFALAPGMSEIDFWAIPVPFFAIGQDF